MRQIKKLISDREIQNKVKSLAKKISKDYRAKDLVLVGVLKGAVIFFGDILKSISIPVYMDFVQVSSYGASMSSKGVTKLKKDVEVRVKGKHVLLIEDIIDYGYTLDFLLKHFAKKKAASVNICVLLDKVSRRMVDVPLKYKGFEVPDKFLVGYGLDYAEKNRNLPYVGFISR